MQRPRRSDFLTLEAYLFKAIAFCNSLSLAENRYDMACDVLRHSCAEYPTVLDKPNPSLTIWKTVQRKLRQLAGEGVRAVNIWWRMEWGPRPTIDLDGGLSSMYVRNRPVRRALRRRRLLVIRVLWRAGLPMEIRHKIVNCIGL